VTDAAAIHRVELAISLLGLTALMTALIVTLDAARFHADDVVAVLAGASIATLDAETVAVTLGAFLSLGAATLATGAGARQLRHERAFLRALPTVGSTTVNGRHVEIVRASGAIAFCAGHLRPRIFVSDVALERLGTAELRAVVAHEGHHADRRDPLRMLLGRALARGLPGAHAFERRRAALAELAADAVAVGSAGGPAPLARALLAFEDSGGVAPERVDRLLGDAPLARVPRAAMALLGFALLCLVAQVALAVAAHPLHALVPAPLLIASAAAVTSRALRPV
jgi:Zn-dependent protease with chaperone function